MTNSNSVSVNLKEYIEQISYKKALTYTKAEVDALIRNGLSDVELVEIVNTLPTGTNIKNNKIYLLNNGKSQTENRFDVYVHTPNNGWEKVDAIDFDITDYYNETQVDNLLAQKAPNNHATTATTYGVSDASKYGHSMASSTSPKMDGTAAVGSETGKFARGDHVHPTDTSRAPNNHASADTTYGAANTVKYGHAMATSTTPKMDGTATMGSETSKFARGDHIHPTDTSRASSTHTHGNITNDGKIGSSTGEIVVTSSGSLTTGNPTTAKIKEASALSNISSSANDTQHTVNDKINTALGNKVDKVSGKGLSTNDFTGTYKTKLDNLETTIANSIGNLDLVEVVTTLPTTNIKDNKLYLKANSVNKNNNKYDIYMYVNNAWEKVDAIDFDLSEYSKTNHTHTSSQITDLSSLLDDKADTEDLSRVAFSGSYLDLSDKPSSHESVYTNMGDVLSSYYIFSKYTEDGDLCLGKLEDIGDIELSVATNAVVTDDEVTYSATVTDIDGDLVPGVYVEFFEDEEIIGTGITNQNGVASYTKIYTESTICDVKAKIGTEEGDITMFVKDKLNLVPHNVWVCGDYSNDLTGFVNNPNNTNTFVVVTDEYSTNGVKSIKLTRLSSGAYWLTIKHIYSPTESDVNKTATLTVDTKNELNNAASLQMNNGSLKYIGIPIGENTITVSTTVLNNSLECIVGFNGATTGNLYVDNIRLNIQ